MKRFVVNKKIASVALSSAMVISNVNYSPMTVKAEELSTEVVQTADVVESTDVVETTELTTENVTETVEESAPVAEETTVVVEETAKETVLPTVAELLSAPVVAPVTTAITTGTGTAPTATGGFTVNSSDNKLNLVSTLTSGNISNTTKPVVDGYLLFPATTKYGELTFKAKINSFGTAAASYNGITIGAFDANQASSVGFVLRDGTSPSRSLYRKSESATSGPGQYGTGSPKITSMNLTGNTYIYSLKATSTGYLISIKDETGKLIDTDEVTASTPGPSKNPMTVATASVYSTLAPGSNLQYGMALTGVDCDITDFTYTEYATAADSEAGTGGTVVYTTKAVASNVAPVVGAVNAPTFDSATNKATVTWTQATAGSGDGKYKVEISKDGGAYTTLASDVTALTYETTLTESGSYKFKISGTSSAGNSTAVESATLTATIGSVAYNPTPTVVNGTGLTSTPGLNWKFAKTGGTLKDLTSSSYFLFPETTDFYTLSGDVVVNSVTSGDNTGVTFGAFSGGTEAPTSLATVGLNGANTTYQYYSNGSNTVGVGGTNTGNGPYVVGTDKVHFTVTKDATGITYTFANGESVYSNTCQYGASWFTPNLTAATASRFGLSFAGVDATVSNLTLKDADGKTLYSQADQYGPKGTAPVVATVTGSVNNTVTKVTANWTASTEATGDGSYKVELSVNDGEYQVIEAGTTAKTATVKVADYGEGTYKFRVTGYLGDAGNTPVISSGIVVNKANAISMAPTVYAPTDVKDSFVAGEGARKWNFKQTASTSTLGSLASDGFLLFPQSSDYNTFECDLEITTATGANTNHGLIVGAFTDADGTTPTAVAGIGARSTNNVRGLYSKGSIGAGGIDAYYEVGSKIHYKVSKTAGGIYIEATYKDSTKEGKLTTSSYTLSYASIFTNSTTKAPVMGTATSERLGISFANVDANVSNMKLTDADGNVLYSQRGTFPPTGNAPVIATVADPTLNAEKTKVGTSWTASTEATIDGAYRVEMSSDGGTTWTTVADETIEKSIEVSTDVAGDYKFRVTPLLDVPVGNAVTTNSVHLVPALKKPSTVDATGTDKSNTVTWSEVTGATYYEVYRRSADETAFTKVSSNTTGLTYTDTAVTNEMPYYYYVRGMNATNFGINSKTVWALPTAGRVGEYVYEGEAAKIALTKKSNDTLLTNSAELEGTVDKAGTLDLYVGGTKVQSKALTAGGAFAFACPLAEGRNDVNLIFTDANGKKTRQTYNFVYLTSYDIVVDPAFTGTEGSTSAAYGNAKVYKTVTAAEASVSATNTERVVIFVKKGTYVERVTVDAPNVSIIGEDRELTSIEYNPNTTTMTARAAFEVKASAVNFSAENVTIKNTYNYTGAVTWQADALDVSAENSIFVNAKLVGYQDTLHATQGKQYYYKCRIEGLVDFIYADKSAQVLFEDSDIVFKYVANKLEGHITAPKHDEAVAYGYTFNNCRVIGEEGCTGAGYDLGRPYGPYAYVVFIDTYMSQIISDGPGWADWSGGTTAEDARFYEQGSYGPGFKVNQRREQLSETQAAKYLTTETLGWDPHTKIADLSKEYVAVVTAKATAITPVSKTFETSDAGKYDITVTGTNLTKGTVILKDADGNTIQPTSVTATTALFKDVTVTANDSTEKVKNVVHTVYVDGVATNLISTAIVPKVVVEVVVPASVSSISPTNKEFSYIGGNYEIVVKGVKLTMDNITLTDGTNTITPNDVTGSTATFKITTGRNESKTENIVKTYTAVLDNVSTGYTSTLKIGKYPTSNGGGGSSSGGGSNSGGSTSKNPIITTDKPSAVDTTPTTETPTTDTGTATVAEPKVSIEAKPVAESVSEKATEYSEANKALLEKTYSEVKVENKADGKPVTLEYDLSGVEMTDADKENLVAVKIDPVTGEVSYLGGFLLEDGTFVTDTKSVDGDFAVIVADPSLYNQATFQIGTTTTVVNGQEGALEAAPQIVQDTTFIPVRAVSEALGAEVTFNPFTKTATVSIDGVSTNFKIGESENGEPATFIENGRLLIPLRKVSETLGANVNWNAADKTIQVTK